MSVNFVRLEKRLAVGLICAALWGAMVPSPALAEDTATDLGIQRAALLRSLFDGREVVALEAPSQQADLLEPLRLDEAVALALKNNFEVLASGAKGDAAGWDVVGAYGGYLPTVTYSRSSGKERSGPASYNDANDDRVQDSKHHRIDKELNIRQPVIDPSLIAEILVRHKSQSAAEIEQDSTRERIAMSTVTTYLQLLSARLQIRFAEDYKAQLDKLNDLMKNRVEGGGAAQADLDRIKARSVSAQSAIIETRSAFDAVMDEFRRLTGVTPTQFLLPGSLLPETPATIEDALTRALRQNPEYLLSAKQVEVQLGERDKALSRLLPKLTFEITKTRTWNAGGAALGSSNNGNDIFPYQNEKRAMLVTSWTINGGTDLAASLSAGAKAREANFKSLDARSRVEQIVRTSFNALNAAQSRIPVLEQAVESNGKVVTAFEEQYINSNRPLFDLLDAYERNYTARADLTRVLLAEAQAGHQIRQQMGELVGALKETEIRVAAAKAKAKTEDAPAPEQAKPEAKPEAKSDVPPPPAAAPREPVAVERGRGRN